MDRYIVASYNDDAIVTDGDVGHVDGDSTIDSDLLLRTFDPHFLG